MKGSAPEHLPTDVGKAPVARPAGRANDPLGLFALQRAAGNNAVAALVQPLAVQREEHPGDEAAVLSREEIRDPAKIQAFDLGYRDAMTGQKPKRGLDIAWVAPYAAGFETGLRVWMGYWDRRDEAYASGKPEKSGHGGPKQPEESEPLQAASFAAGHVADVILEQVIEHFHLRVPPIPVALILELSMELKSDTPMFDPDERRKEREKYAEEQRESLRAASDRSPSEEDLGWIRDEQDAGSAKANEEAYKGSAAGR